MFIFPNLSKYVFVSLLISQTNVSFLKAMENPAMDVEITNFQFDDFSTTKILFGILVLDNLPQNFNVNNDVRNLILSNLICLYKIQLTSFADFLKKKTLQKNLDAILTVINQLFIAYGHNESVYLLKITLKTAEILISDIKDKNYATLLHHLCQPKYKTWNHCVKIILCAAEDDAIAIICKCLQCCQKPYDQPWSSYMPLHYALVNNREDIVDIFMAHFVDNKSKESIFLTKTAEQWTALHIAAASPYSPSIFKKLIDSASTVPDLVQKLLTMKTAFGKTVEDLAEDSPEIIDIINSYRYC